MTQQEKLMAPRKDIYEEARAKFYARVEQLQAGGVGFLAAYQKAREELGLEARILDAMGAHGSEGGSR